MGCRNSINPLVTCPSASCLSITPLDNGHWRHSQPTCSSASSVSTMYGPEWGKCAHLLRQQKGGGLINLAHLECLHDGPEPIADAALAAEILLAVAAVPEHGPSDTLDSDTLTATPISLDTAADTASIIPTSPGLIPCSCGPFPAVHRLRVLLCILLNPWWAGFPGDSCNLEERLLSKGHHSLHIVKHNLQDE